MTRLSKVDAEALLDLIDEHPERVLTEMLGKVLDRPGATWDLLVGEAFDGERRAALLARQPAALDTLAAELNEHRGLAPPC